MIFPEITYALIVMAVLFLIYAFWDTENRYYGNVFAEFFAIVILFFVAFSFMMGTAVQPASVVANSTSVAEGGTFVNTTYTYVDTTTPMTNPALAILFGFVAIGLSIHLFLSVAVILHPPEG